MLSVLSRSFTKSLGKYSLYPFLSDFKILSAILVLDLLLFKNGSNEIYGIGGGNFLVNLKNHEFLNQIQLIKL